MSLPRRLALLLMAAIAFASPRWGGAQSFEFHAPLSASDAKTPAVMRDLAERLLPVYQDSDPDRYLANLSVLQLTAGDYSAAVESRESLRERRRRADSGRPVVRGRVLDLYARAMAIETDSHVPFSEAFAKAYQEVFSKLSDHDAFLLSGWLSAAPQEYQESFQRLLDEQRSKDIVNQQEAETLLSAFVYFEAYGSLAPWVGALNAADEASRYKEEEVTIKVPGRANLSARVVRPKMAAAALPALLEVGIDRPTVSAKESAAHGYVGVFADLRRGRAGAFVPYQHDGEAARAVIDWIAKQPWSDGRVAMYGEGYSGFTAWAAAARMPPALKALAVVDPTAPGIDAPMSGSIFQNSGYRWSLEVANTKQALEASFGDDAIWRALDEKWYRSGRRYRDLGSIYGKPNPDLHPLAEPSELRPLLAGHDPVSQAVFADRFSGAHHDRLFRGRRARGALLLRGASSLQPTGGPHLAHRALRRRGHAARRVRVDTGLRSRHSGAPGFARAALSVARPCAEGRGGSRATQRPGEFRGHGRERVAARTVPAGHGRLLAEVLPRRRRGRRARGTPADPAQEPRSPPQSTRR